MSNATVQMRSMRERVQAADRARRWREENEHRPDVRRCDRVLVEALVEHLRRLPPGDGMLARLIDDAVIGLTFQGFPEEHARRELAKRIRYHIIGPGLSTGSVSAALKQQEIEQAARTP
jgi:hypothetical protein